MISCRRNSQTWSMNDDSVDVSHRSQWNVMNMAVYEMLPSPADILWLFGIIKKVKMKLILSQRKWPEERIPVDLEPIPGFNLRAQVVGQGGAYVKHIQQRTRCKVQIKGRGSGFIEHNTGRESDEPMYLHVA